MPQLQCIVEQRSTIFILLIVGGHIVVGRTLYLFCQKRPRMFHVSHFKFGFYTWKRPQTTLWKGSPTHPVLISPKNFNIKPNFSNYITKFKAVQLGYPIKLYSLMWRIRLYQWCLALTITNRTKTWFS